MSSQKLNVKDESSESKYYFIGEESLEQIAFERLKVAFCFANLQNEEFLRGESFIQLCELSRDSWNKDHIEKYTLENFSTVLENWLSSEAVGKSFEADMWRQNVPEFIFSIIYLPVNRASNLQDYISVLFEKGCNVESIFRDSLKDEFDLTNPILKNEVNYFKYYLIAIAKILLEYEKQSKQMNDYALKKALNTKLFDTAEQVLFVVANAGGFASTSLISQIFSNLGKEHINFNDDLKQLCEQNLLIKQGSKKYRIFLLPPLKELMSSCPIKTT